MGMIKDWNGLDLTEAEDIKKSWQEYIEEVYKKDLHNPDNHNGVITHLEPNVLVNLGALLFSHSVMYDSLWPHGLQHARLPCTSSSPGACSNSCPLSWWCHPTISSSFVPFSSCLQSFTTSESSLMNWHLTSDDQSFGASTSASVFSMNIQD